MTPADLHVNTARQALEDWSTECRTPDDTDRLPISTNQANSIWQAAWRLWRPGQAMRLLAGADPAPLLAALDESGAARHLRLDPDIKAEISGDLELAQARHEAQWTARAAYVTWPLLNRPALWPSWPAGLVADGLIASLAVDSADRTKQIPLKSNHPPSIYPIFTLELGTEFQYEHERTSEAGRAKPSPADRQRLWVTLLIGPLFGDYETYRYRATGPAQGSGTLLERQRIHASSIDETLQDLQESADAVPDPEAALGEIQALQRQLEAELSPTLRLALTRTQRTVQSKWRVAERGRHAAQEELARQWGRICQPHVSLLCHDLTQPVQAAAANIIPILQAAGEQFPDRTPLTRWIAAELCAQSCLQVLAERVPTRRARRQAHQAP